MCKQIPSVVPVYRKGYQISICTITKGKFKIFQKKALNSDPCPEDEKSKKERNYII